MKHTHIRFPKLTRLQRLVRPALAGPAPGSQSPNTCPGLNA